MPTTTARTPSFKASAARIGNSRGFRVDASMFQQHPELIEGPFEATYVGDGTVLIRRTAPKPGRSTTHVDPVVAAYLAWTEQAMQQDPQLLRPMTRRELQVAEALVAGVIVDLEQDRLPDEFALP
jgi:hypothetical protein